MQDREFVEVDLPFSCGTKKLGPISEAPSPTPSGITNQSLFTDCCGKSNCCRKVGKYPVLFPVFVDKDQNDELFSSR